MPRSIVWRQVFPATMAVAFFVFSGCGYSGHAPVHGKVMFDGAPVEDGVITFVSNDSAHVSAGGLIKNGAYSIPAAQGPVPGPNRVEIQIRKKTGKKVGTPGDESVLMDEVVEVAPAKYNNSSTLTADVKASDNTIDFVDLKP